MTTSPSTSAAIPTTASAPRPATIPAPTSDRRRSLTSSAPRESADVRPRVRTTALLASLDREWARTAGRPGSLRRARAWPTLACPTRLGDALAIALSRCRSLDDLVGATQGGATDDSCGPSPDLVLAALVVSARRDDLAGRVVLQRILPGIISQSRRYSGGVDPDERIAQAIGAAWLAIRSFDVERRPRNVAAALISDTMWNAFRRASRRRSAGEIPSPDEVFATRAAAPDDLDPVVALAATIRAAELAGASSAHVDLIRDLVRVGSPSELARRREVTPRTIRNHRDAAVAEIRRALGPDWTDADERLSAVA